MLLTKPWFCICIGLVTKWRPEGCKCLQMSKLMADVRHTELFEVSHFCGCEVHLKPEVWFHPQNDSIVHTSARSVPFLAGKSPIWENDRSINGGIFQQAMFTGGFFHLVNIRKNYMENHHFSWESQLFLWFLWPSSIANCYFIRG